MEADSTQLVPTTAAWHRAVAAFAKNNSNWPRQGYVGSPGLSSFKCPPDILHKHGIDPGHRHDEKGASAFDSSGSWPTYC